MHYCFTIVTATDKALITYAIRYDMRDPPAPSSYLDKVVPFSACFWYLRGAFILVCGLLFFQRRLIPQVPSEGSFDCR